MAMKRLFCCRLSRCGRRREWRFAAGFTDADVVDAAVVDTATTDAAVDADDVAAATFALSVFVVFSYGRALDSDELLKVLQGTFELVVRRCGSEVDPASGRRRLDDASGGQGRILDLMSFSVFFVNPAGWLFETFWTVEMRRV